MTALLKRKKFTLEEYLSLEENCEYRSQFYFGEIFAMSGASLRHVSICGNIAAPLHTQLRRRPCRVMQSDMRVAVNENFYTYPDVVVVCGEPQLIRKHGENLTNPTIICEVLSPSTRAFDRGEKAFHYRTMPSLREYFIVSQDRIFVEHFVKNDVGKWILNEITDENAILELSSVECEIALADIYEKVDFADAEDETE